MKAVFYFVFAVLGAISINYASANYWIDTHPFMWVGGKLESTFLFRGIAAASCGRSICKTGAGAVIALSLLIPLIEVVFFRYFVLDDFRSSAIFTSGRSSHIFSSPIFRLQFTIVLCIVLYVITIGLRLTGLSIFDANYSFKLFTISITLSLLLLISGVISIISNVIKPR